MEKDSLTASELLDILKALYARFYGDPGSITNPTREVLLQCAEICKLNVGQFTLQGAAQVSVFLNAFGVSNAELDEAVIQRGLKEAGDIWATINFLKGMVQRRTVHRELFNRCVAQVIEKLEKSGPVGAFVLVGLSNLPKCGELYNFPDGNEAYNKAIALLLHRLHTDGVVFDVNGLKCFAGLIPTIDSQKSAGKLGKDVGFSKEFMANLQPYANRQKVLAAVAPKLNMTPLQKPTTMKKLPKVKTDEDEVVEK
jgi:hypothetical protein